MVIFRFVALLLIVASLMLLGGDLFAMLEAGDGGFLAHTHSVEQIWAMLHPASLDAASASFAAAALGLPASLTLGGVGLVLAFLFRSRD